MSDLSIVFTDDLGESRILENPDFSEVVKLINQLDQDFKYYLEIIYDETHKMLIGGGSGKYMVNICEEDLLTVLINPDGDEESTVPVYIGQESEYPTNLIVSLTEVISAVKFYYENKEANSNQEWQ